SWAERKRGPPFITKVTPMKNFSCRLPYRLPDYRNGATSGDTSVFSSPESLVRSGSVAACRVSPRLGAGRNQSKSKDQGGAGVSGTGKAHEDHGRGEGPDHGRGQRHREGRKADWRAPGTGERRSGCGQEMAFRTRSGRVNGRGAIPF